MRRGGLSNKQPLLGCTRLRLKSDSLAYRAVSDSEPLHPPARRWLRRVGWTLLVLSVILAIFHRPLLKGLIHVVAVKVAAKQNIQLSLDVRGTVLTNLALENIKALPAGGVSPVENIDIELVRVRYSFISLLRHGVSDFLQSYELRNANITVKPVEGTRSQKRDLGQTLTNILQKPALFSDRVNVRNLNLVAHVPDGEFAIKNVNLFLDPVKPGLLHIDRIQIPKIRAWENIDATATYAKRDLVLHGLKLDDELQFRIVELDASRRAEKINRLSVSGTVFGGETALSTFIHETGKKKADVKIAANSKGVSLERIARFMRMKAPASGSIGDFSFAMNGDPNVPASWNIQGLGVIDNIAAGPAAVDQVAGKLTVHDGVVQLAADLVRGTNKANVQMHGKLPESADAFVRSEFEGSLQVAAPELRDLVSNLNGSIVANGQFGLHARKFTAALDLAAKDIGMEKLGIGSATAKIGATKVLPEPPPKNAHENETGRQVDQRQKEERPATIFDGLQSNITASFQDARAERFAADFVTVAVSSSENHATLESLEINRAANKLTASGTCDVPRHASQLQNTSFDARFAIEAPSVNAFYAEPDLNAPNARLTATGHISHDAAGYAGRVSANAVEIAFRDFSADRLALEIALTENTATIETLNLALNPADGFAGSGHVELRAPFRYDGALQVQLHDLSKFDSLVPNLKGGLAGSVSLNWSGSGEVRTIRHSGSIDLKVANAEAGDALKAINAEVAGAYSPEFIDVPTLTVTTDKGDFAAAISLRDQLFAVRDIVVKKGKQQLLSGSLSLPLDLRTPGNRQSIVPLTGPVAVNLETSDIVLETLLPQPSAASGVAKATITASGTIEAPDAKIHLDARALKIKSAPKLAPATVTLDMTLFENKVALQGRVNQPAINPVEIAGTLPFPVREIIASGKIDEQSPVQLSVRLPQSSVAFLSQAVPMIRYAEGSVSAHVDVDGTIASPALSGALDVDTQALRFVKADMPAISNFRGAVQFAGNEITVSRFGGDIAGGPFDLTGTIQLPKLTEPAFDLRMVSTGALLVRNESLTVRADADVRVIGPFNAASVTGEVGVTRSRFFREIEILPIQLPGRPAPKPPETSPGIAFPNPPLRDWSFNVKIKTKDAFLVRGNLANGQVSLDLALVGNGRSPALEGTVTIQNFVASLPFSKLEVNDSYVYFSQDDPFVPKLDIHGSSTMRDNDIKVYIYGTPADPQTVFTSEPPLPQEDIIALLATGTTASELTGGGDVLAGRALVLATQRLSRMIFKKKAPPAEEKESFLSRFNVDVGGVDPRTGQQEVSTSFKAAERFYLIGDLDVQGNVRGQVKYLLRFR